MVLNYTYGIVMIHLLPVNHFLSIDLKIKCINLDCFRAQTEVWSLFKDVT